MFLYDGLTLLCCCVGLVMFAVIIAFLAFILSSTDRRKKRRSQFKQKLEDFKKKNGSKYGKTSSNKPANNAEDAEFREVTK
ncbi:MAG: hypothetical protein ACMG57_02155 [Candidatus Dojkabacteria bacterium]